MPGTDSDSAERLRRFRRAYGLHRAAEGRGSAGIEELLSLPNPSTGVLAAQWRIRRCTYRRFVSAVLMPCAKETGPRPLRLVDLGAGNGWLCYRVAQLGHEALALDIRCDSVDGLGAAAPYASYLPKMFARVAASFDAIPVVPQTFDIAVFNASLHYAEDLNLVLKEAARVVRSNGWITVLDSPVYSAESHGQAMVEEKHRQAHVRFGEHAAELMALASVEYLTRARLASASRQVGLQWSRHRVWYPLWYELRPVLAVLSRRRPPSRFDLWVARRP